jgi:hypothetical protein
MVKFLAVLSSGGAVGRGVKEPNTPTGPRASVTVKARKRANRTDCGTVCTKIAGNGKPTYKF